MRNWLRQRWELQGGVTLTFELEGPVPVQSTTLRLAQEVSSTVERHLAAYPPPAPRSARVEGGYGPDPEDKLRQLRQSLAEGVKARREDGGDG